MHAMNRRPLVSFINIGHFLDHLVMLVFPTVVVALDSWVEHYNTRRAHTALGGQPPISRLSRSH